MEGQREEILEVRGNGYANDQSRGDFSLRGHRCRFTGTQGVQDSENRELSDSENCPNVAGSKSTAAGPATNLRTLRTKVISARRDGDTVASREVSLRASVHSEVKAASKCKKCDPRCWVFLGILPTKRIAHEEGMKLLERTAEVHWDNFCHQHIRLLAANCAGLYNNEGGKKHVLIRRMRFVLKHRHHPTKVARQKSTWFRKLERKLAITDHLGPYMWLPSEPEAFDFDAERIFNRYAGSDNAWA